MIHRAPHSQCYITVITVSDLRFAGLLFLYYFVLCAIYCMYSQFRSDNLKFSSSRTLQLSDLPERNQAGLLTMDDDKVLAEEFSALSCSGLSLDSAVKESSEIRDELWKLDNPMRWLIDAKLEKVFVDVFTDEEESTQAFKADQIHYLNRGVFRLVRVVVKWFEKKYDEGLAKCLDIEENLIFSDEHIRKAFNYVSSVTKALIYVELGDTQSSKQELEMLRTVEQEYNKNRKIHSFILACKACVFKHCSSQGEHVTVNTIREAWHMNQSDGLLCFLCGLLMSQVRYFKFPRPAPSIEEITYLKCARVLDPKNARIAVFLARTYSDYAKSTKDYSYSSKASSLLMSVMESYKDVQPGLIMRAALILLKNRACSVGFLEECVRYAVAEAPEITIVRHQAGEFFFRIKKFEEAMINFEVVKNQLPFLLGLILTLKVKCKQQVLPSPEEFIEETVSNLATGSKEYKVTAYLSVSEYYLLVCSDLQQASQFYIKADQIKETMKMHTLTTVPPSFKYIFYEPVLLDALLENHRRTPVMEQALAALRLNDDVVPKLDYPRSFDLEAILKKFYKVNK